MSFIFRLFCTVHCSFLFGSFCIFCSSYGCCSSSDWISLIARYLFSLSRGRVSAGGSPLEDLHCRVSIEESPPESFRYRSPFCSCINQMLFHGINLFTRQTRLYQMACIVVTLVLTCVCTLPKFINYRPVILKPSRLLDRLSSVWQIHVPDFTQGGFCMRLML